MNARKLRTGTLTLSTLGAVWLAASSCSVLYDFNTKQCSTTDDCIHKGSAFANSVCQNNVCVAVAATGGAPSTGGQSSTSEATGGDISTAGGTSATGGTSLVGGDSSTGGTSAATTTAPSCVNADCLAAHVDPYTCINGTCTPLLTTDCPVLLPGDSAGQYSAKELLKKSSPIIVGGFASMTNIQNPADTQAVVNWNLALTEFNSKTLGGLQSYDGSGVSRPLIGLVCQGYNASTASVDTDMAHLVQDLRAPAVLSTLSPANLYEAYNFTTRPSYTVDNNGQDVFFMSSGSATLQLTTLNDNGLVWHMLGNPRLLAATVAALVKKIEPVVQAARLANFQSTGVDDPSVDSSLRVTLIYSDNATMTDVHDVLLSDADHPETLLSFNGALATDPVNGSYFHQAQVVSGSATVTTATQAIANTPPHIIVAMGTSEFPKYVVPTIENTWNSTAAGRMRPYYVMSSSIYNGADLKTALKGQISSVVQIEKRLVGINWAQITDSRSVGLYNPYYSNLISSYPPTGALISSLDGTENMYDAAYYLLYSIAAAEVNRKPSNPVSGSNILSGLLDKVINVGAAYQDTGPTSLPTILNQLQTIGSGFKMALWGLDGPPNFDTTTGTRNFPTSVWCMAPDSTAVAPNPPYKYVPDGLLYDAANKAFTAPSSGVPACLQAYQ